MRQLYFRVDFQNAIWISIQAPCDTFRQIKNAFFFTLLNSSISVKTQLGLFGVTARTQADTERIPFISTFNAFIL